VPQIRPLADIVHFKYVQTYILTYLNKWLKAQQTDSLIVVEVSDVLPMESVDTVWHHEWRHVFHAVTTTLGHDPGYLQRHVRHTDKHTYNWVHTARWEASFSEAELSLDCTMLKYDDEIQNCTMP